MADKRIFQLEEEGFLDDITDKVYMWLDKKANEGETQEPSWKFKANVFLKILNNFATKFVPNVLTVEGKCYWHDGELYVCDTAYTGDWVPGNFTATSIDALFARIADVTTKANLLGTASTAADMDSTHAFTLVKNDGTQTKLPANLVAKASEQAALTTYAQNVANSIAPNFDPTRTSGNMYVAGRDIVTYTDGFLYIFKNDHYGAWNSSDVLKIDLTKGVNLSDLGLTDLNEILAPGEYYCPTSYVSSVSNVPSGITKSFSLSVTMINKSAYDDYVLQTLYCDETKKTYHRRLAVGGQGTDTEWSDVLSLIDLEVLGVTDLNNLLTIGEYFCSATYSQSVTNKPAGVGSFTIKVSNIADGRFYQELTQMSVCNTFGRAVNGDGTVYRDWKKTDEGSINLSDLGATDLDDVLDEGEYFCPTLYVSSVSNVPSNVTKSFQLSVKLINSTVNGTYVVQTLYCDDTKMTYRRVRARFAGGTSTNWESNEIVLSDLSSTSITDLNNLVAVGEYFCSATYSGSVTNKPDGVGSFTIKVCNIADGRFYQELTQIVNRVKYGRAVNSDGTVYSDWIREDSSSLDLETLGITDLDDVLTLGKYYCKKSYVPSVLNFPCTVEVIQRPAINLGSFELEVLENKDLSGHLVVTQRLTICDIGRVYVRKINASSGVKGDWLPVGSGSDTKYIAIGDSFARGVYHTIGNTDSGKTDKGYPYWIWYYKGFKSVSNQAVGGSGWVRPAPSTSGHEDQLNAVGKVDSINFAGYDLVTIQYGANDWSYSYAPLGSLQTSSPNDGTVIGNMLYCLNKIMEDNPAIQIIVVTNLNQSSVGDLSTRYALDYENTYGYTLKDTFNAMKEVCDHYGISFIDMSEGSPVNLYNIKEVLPDDKHPYEAFYQVIGKNIAARIDFS